MSVQGSVHQGMGSLNGLDVPHDQVDVEVTQPRPRRRARVPREQPQEHEPPKHEQPKQEQPKQEEPKQEQTSDEALFAELDALAKVPEGVEFQRRCEALKKKYGLTLKTI